MEAVNHFAHTVYHLEFREGKVIGLRYWNLTTNEDILCVKRDTYKRFKDVFENAIATLCHDTNFYDFAGLFTAMQNDPEYLASAKKVIAKELMNMARQVERITHQYWIDYIK